MAERKTKQQGRGEGKSEGWDDFVIEEERARQCGQSGDMA